MCVPQIIIKAQTKKRKFEIVYKKYSKFKLLLLIPDISWMKQRQNSRETGNDCSTLEYCQTALNVMQKLLYSPRYCRILRLKWRTRKGQKVDGAWQGRLQISFYRSQCAIVLVTILVFIGNAAGIEIDLVTCRYVDF